MGARECLGHRAAWFYLSTNTVHSENFTINASLSSVHGESLVVCVCAVMRGLMHFTVIRIIGLMNHLIIAACISDNPVSLDDC